MTIVRAILPALLIAALPGAAAAVPPCPELGARGHATAPPRCRDNRPRKIEPYDPDRLKAGSRPGFIDLGGGTEVRVGGRARMDYQSRR